MQYSASARSTLIDSKEKSKKKKGRKIEVVSQDLRWCTPSPRFTRFLNNLMSCNICMQVQVPLHGLCEFNN